MAATWYMVRVCNGSKSFFIVKFLLKILRIYKLKILRVYIYIYIWIGFFNNFNMLGVYWLGWEELGMMLGRFAYWVKGSSVILFP